MLRDKHFAWLPTVIVGHYLCDNSILRIAKQDRDFITPGNAPLVGVIVAAAVFFAGRQTKAQHDNR